MHTRALVLLLSAALLTAATAPTTLSARIDPMPASAPTPSAGGQAAAPSSRPTETAPAAAVRPVATIKQVMHAIVIPSSDAVFKAAGEPPSDAAAWTTVQHQALAVAEAGNLLMIGNRPVDRGDWMRRARAMVDAAAEAASAADQKNGAALGAAGDKLYDTCEACHEKYVKK